MSHIFLRAVSVVAAFFSLVAVIQVRGEENRPLPTKLAPLVPEQKDYVDAKTFEDAIQILQRELVNREQRIYAPLFTVEGIKHAIETSIRHIEHDNLRMVQNSTMAEEKKRLNEKAGYFTDVIKPVYEDAIRTGNWPKGAFFLPTPKRPLHSEFAVNMHVDVRTLKNIQYEALPGIKPTGHAVQILRVSYGAERPAPSATLEVKSES